MTDIVGLIARCEKDLDKAGIKEWVTVRQDDLRELLGLIPRVSGLAERRLATAGYVGRASLQQQAFPSNQAFIPEPDREPDP